MISDWENNAVLISGLLPQQHPEIVRQLKMLLSQHQIPLVILPGTSDIWIRDAAPVEIQSNHFVQFRYRPDYLRGHEGLITPPGVFNGLSFIKKLKTSALVVDGGNIVGTASTAILTDKVLTENPRYNRTEMKDKLKRLLQVERVILIPKEPYDTIGHSDGQVRFIDENTVVMNDYSKVDPRFGVRLRSSLERHGLKIKLLPYSIDDAETDGIGSAVGNFVNFLRVGNLFIVPSYGISNDTKAINRLKTLCPKATLVQLDCRKLAKKGGVLNCASWTIRVPEGQTA